MDLNAISNPKVNPRWRIKSKFNARSPSYKTQVGAKLGVFFVFCQNHLFRQNELVQGG